VLEIVSAIHIVADLTLGLGKVVYDYLQQPSRQALRIHEMSLGDLSGSGNQAENSVEATCHLGSVG
jgi:hypothetical protein